MDLIDAIPNQVDFHALDIANKLYPHCIKYDTEGRQFNRAMPTVCRMLRKIRFVIEVKGKHLVFWADKTLA